MSTTTCPWCKGVIERKSGRGRPSVYCSDRCRRYAYEQRRAAEREGEPVRVVVEKTPPHTIQRTRQVWVKPDPNALADALDENPELVGPVLERIVQLAVGRRLSERSRVRLGISVAHFVAQLIKARSPWSVYPAAATARDFTAEQWGQLAAAGDQITAAERALDVRAEMLTRYEELLRRDREQYQQRREWQEEQTAQKYALAREHERETRRIRDRLQVLEAQARYQGGQKGPGPGSSFYRPTT
jgi:hypothetical protein